MIFRIADPRWWARQGAVLRTPQCRNLRNFSHFSFAVFLPICRAKRQRTSSSSVLRSVHHKRRITRSGLPSSSSIYLPASWQPPAQPTSGLFLSTWYFTVSLVFTLSMYKRRHPSAWQVVVGITSRIQCPPPGAARGLMEPRRGLSQFPLRIAFYYYRY